MITQPILILQPDHRHPPGYLGDWLARRGLQTMAVALRADTTALPRAIRQAHRTPLVVLGAAPAADRPRWWASARDTLREAHAAGAPILALGSGAELVTEALGGTLSPTPNPVRGWFPLALHPQAARAPWLNALGATAPAAFLWQTHAVQPPCGAVTLYSGAHVRCQAFAAGSALVLCFHPHLNLADYDEWLGRSAQWAAPSATVQTAVELAACGKTRIDAQRRFADRCFDLWLAGQPV
ncbi:MAG: hypothetical protein WD928_03795 [Gammaproteobacteria bacterium]